MSSTQPAVFDGFNGPSFDVVKWVNDALSSGSQGTTPAEDSNISSLIAKLQVLSQDTTDSVELCMSQILGAIPRCERELVQIESEVSALSQDFDVVVKQASQIDLSGGGGVDAGNLKPGLDGAAEEKAFETVAARNVTAGYIEDLEVLDRVKRNMEDTKTLLHEAAAWDRLVREVDIVFEGSDLGRIADHIGMLQRSANALSDLPDADKRGEMLEAVNGKFEEMVLPQLRAALLQDNNDTLAKLVEVFARMGQLKFVCASFAKARVGPLTDLWRDSYDPHMNFLDWMSSYYGDCLRILSREYRRIQRLFVGKPASYVMAAVLSEVWVPKSHALMPALDSPSHARTPQDGTDSKFAEQFQQRITARCALKDVVALYGCALQFAEQVALTIPVQCFRRSALLAIMQPYVVYHKQYAALEIEFLVSHIAKLRLDEIAEVSPTDAIAAARSVLPALRDCIQQTCGRCITLTNGLELDGVRAAVSALLEKFVGALNHVVIAIKNNVSSNNTSAGEEEKKTQVSTSSDWLDVEERGPRLSTGDQRGNVDAALRLLSACDGLVRLVSDVGDKIRLIGCQSIEPLNKALALSKEWRGSIASGDTVFQEDIPTATTTSPTSSGTPSQEEASEDARQLPLVVAGSLLLDEPSKEETLRRLITDCTQGRSVLGSSFDACETLDLAAQEVLFDVMVAPIRAKLNTMPPAASWAAASMNGFDGGMTTPDDDEDAFAYSMQPLPYITGVGENLLVTVHLLEPIATGEYQRTAQLERSSFAGFGGVDWTAVCLLLNISRPYSKSDMESEALAVLNTALVGSNQSTALSGSGSGSSIATTTPTPATSPLDVARAYSTLWLAAVVRACVCALLARALAIPTLSQNGARQLQADFDYLCNVVAALGFAPDPVFVRVKDLVGVSAEQLTQAVASNSSTGQGLPPPPAGMDPTEDMKLLRKIAAARQH